MRHLSYFLTSFALCFIRTLAWSSAEEGGFDDWFYDVGRPSSQTSGRCRKDILLIVDTSYSIGKPSFRDDVKPFLQRLVTDPALNIGHDGTQLALIIFSHKYKTKLLLNFGDIYDADKLADYIRGMRWDDVSGGHTRTDLALKIANDQVFSSPNPANNRPDIDDVIILITDGEPRGTSNTKSEAIRYAGLLKDKGILIVGAAVGPTRHRFKGTLIKLATSANHVMDADFKNMDDILERLVASSCIKPGQCECHNTARKTIYVKPGRSKVNIEWPVPTFSCMTGRKPSISSTTVVPRVTSPHKFSIGEHTITYTFKLKGGVDVSCPVSFRVKGEMCRGLVFNSRTQVCCCGTIHERKTGHECCGPDYYNTYDQRCCKNANLISRDESCPSD